MKTRHTLITRLNDFLSHPLRINFLSLPIAITIASLPWLLTGLNRPTAIAAYPFHLYLFIDLIAAAAYGGFLLTALPSWTHHPHPIRRTATLLYLLWLAALLSATHPISHTLLAVYWLTLLTYALRLSWRDTRQHSLHYTLTLITLLHLAYRHNPEPHHLHAMLHIHLIALMLIQFRVGTVIGNQALQDAYDQRTTHPQHTPAWLLAAREPPRFIPNPIAKNLAALSLSLLALAIALKSDPQLQGWLALASSGALIANLQAWHHKILLRHPYIRTFYAALLLPALGYLLLSHAHLTHAAPYQSSAALHAIAIGGYLLMTLNIMHIAGLRHSGQTLRYTLKSRTAFALIITAALSRSLLSPLSLTHAPSTYLHTTYTLPAFCLITAFTLYLLRFYPIFRDHPATDGE